MFKVDFWIIRKTKEHAQAHIKMVFTDFVFYALASILVLSGACVVTVRNPVHAALFLVLAFFNAAGIWLLLQAEFLAIALVLVYVGAVMVLFLFVVMMLDLNLNRLREGFWHYLPVALLVGILIVIEMVMVLRAGSKHSMEYTHANLPSGYSHIKVLGRLIYTDYVYPFEIAAVILLVAIVAAIALTLRGRKDSKYQNPGQQVSVKRADRIQLISMSAEPKQ